MEETCASSFDKLTGGEPLVSWGRAWRAAGAWFGWSLVWGFLGLVLLGVGFAIFARSEVYSIWGGYSYSAGGMVGGIVLMVIGLLIYMLGSVAAFFKINSEITSEEVRKQIQTHGSFPQTSGATPMTSSAGPPCPTCGSPLIFIQQYQKWYCVREGKYA